MEFSTWPPGLRWIDGAGEVARAPDMASVLLVAFWTVDDVSAVEIAQVLGYLALRFVGRPLTVVAVHPSGSTPERVARAARRFGFQVPVAVDLTGAAVADLGTGRSPSLWLGDRKVGERFRGSGVPERLRLARAVESLLDEASAAGQEPAPAPCVSFAAAADVAEDPERVRLDVPTGLAWAADPELGAGQLWIADGGPRPRLLAVEIESPSTERPEAVLRRTVGDGRPGSTDGDPSLAAFAAPAGLCVDDGLVHVADLGNHLVRSVDPDHLGVTTLLGLGRAVVDPDAGRAGLRQGLAAPTDIAVLDAERLVVAVAGSHQLWAVGRHDGHAEPLVGTGVAGSIDGMRHDATCTTPVAVAVKDGLVAFVEQATGAVRVLELASELIWSWVAAWQGPKAPCALAWLGGDLLVADPPRGEVLRVRGSDHAIERFAGPAQGLIEPTSLAVLDGGQVAIGDAGRGEVLLVAESGAPARSLRLRDPHPEPEFCSGAEPTAAAPGSTLSISFPMPLPAGDRLHEDVLPHAWVRPESAAPLTAVDLPVEREGEWGTLRDLPVADSGCGRVAVTIRYATGAEPDAVAHLQELRGAFDLAVDPDLVGPQYVDLSCR